MAKSHSRGPGVETRGGVSGTMGNANKVSTTGQTNGMGAPFSHPRAGGNGGSNIPTHVYDGNMPKVSVPKPGAGQGNSPIMGGQGGQKRPGTE